MMFRTVALEYFLYSSIVVACVFLGEVVVQDNAGYDSDVERFFGAVHRECDVCGC